MNSYFHTVPWYVSRLPFRWQVAWIWLSFFKAGNPVVYPGDWKDLMHDSERQRDALQELERGCRNAGLGYQFIYDRCAEGLLR